MVLADYTTQVRTICENIYGLDTSADLTMVEEVIANAAPIIFYSNFPIFDENYRMTLCTKILRHFYTREIGLETVGLWKLKLNTKLLEIMPFYNKMYESELLKFNPLYDVDLTRLHNVKNTGTQEMNGKVDSSTSNTQNTNTSSSGSTDTDTTDDGKQTSKNTRTHMDAYSDTPQGSLTGVQELNYLTNARNITDTENVESDSSNTVTTHSSSSDDVDATMKASGTTNTDSTTKTLINNLEDYIETVTGKQGTRSYTSMLMEFRESFLNIDMMIINELNDLFMLIW